MAEVYRNQGLGRELMRHLLSIGKASGGKLACLQVILNNSAALRLYAKCDFQEIYRYHYRKLWFEGGSPNERCPIDSKG